MCHNSLLNHIWLTYKQVTKLHGISFLEDGLLKSVVFPFYRISFSGNMVFGWAGYTGEQDPQAGAQDFDDQ